MGQKGKRTGKKRDTNKRNIDKKTSSLTNKKGIKGQVRRHKKSSL